MENPAQNPRFVQIGRVVLNLDNVFSVVLDKPSVIIHSNNGFCHTFSGEDAEAARKFFSPVQEQVNEQAPSGV